MRIFKKVNDRLYFTNKQVLIILRTYYKAIYGKELKTTDEANQFLDLITRRRWQYDPAKARNN